MRRVVILGFLIGMVFLDSVLTSPAQQKQKISDLDRARSLDMLKLIADDVRKHYYDPKLHGFDFDGRVKEAETRMREAASLGEAFNLIAWALDGLKDSHTYFSPAPRSPRMSYGWQMEMVGDRCYVTQVRPGDDAEAKGVKPGDEILSVNGIAPTRGLFPKIHYLFYVLSPLPALPLQVRSPDGKQRQVDVMAKMREVPRHVDLTTGANFWDLIREFEAQDRMTRTRYTTAGDNLIIFKMAEFNLSGGAVEDALGKIGKHKTLILDLRDNPGGSVDTLSRFLGGFFDHEVKIGDRIGRQPMKPEMTKSHGKDAYAGKIIVLVDSRSASAAEIFARVMQIEKRGTVLGDRSSGYVMEGKRYSYTIGTGPVVFFGALITDADLIMTDGKSLEGRGVEPDELILPSPADLAARRDPVMVRAIELAGVKMTPEAAGKLFPYEWPKQ